MTDTLQNPVWTHPLRIADLPTKKPTRFELIPDAAVLAEIVQYLNLSELRKLRFKGTLQPLGRQDWELQARIGATVVQPCIITLDPVATRIDEDVVRTFIAEGKIYEAGSEVEMEGDDTLEVLTPVVDIGELMLEALALHLPLYPRSSDAALAEADFTEPGKTPMKDEDARPFAGLKSLRDKLEDNGE